MTDTEIQRLILHVISSKWSDVTLYANRGTEDHRCSNHRAGAGADV